MGYALNHWMTIGLVIQALFRTVSTKRPGKDLVVQSDRGNQYSSYAFAKVLKQFNLNASMMPQRRISWEHCKMR